MRRVHSADLMKSDDAACEPLVRRTIERYTFMRPSLPFFSMTHFFFISPALSRSSTCRPPRGNSTRRATLSIVLHRSANGECLKCACSAV